MNTEVMRKQIKRGFSFARSRLDEYSALAFVLVGALLLSMPVSAQDAPTLPEIDPQPLFDGIGTYLPWIFAILAIPAGIMLAVKIAKFIIKAFEGAFSM